MRCESCRKPWDCFLNKRVCAKLRGVAWELTYKEWADIWDASGKSELRGSGKGKYCMARHGDAGPYAVSNVSIQLTTQNSFDAAKLTRAGRMRNGNPPKGWVFVKANPKKPYQVAVSKCYIGNFATQAEAESAYAAEIARRGYIQTASNLCDRRAHQINRSRASGSQSVIVG